MTSLEPLNAVSAYRLLERAIDKIAALPGPATKATWFARSVPRVLQWSDERCRRTQLPIEDVRRTYIDRLLRGRSDK